MRAIRYKGWCIVVRYKDDSPSQDSPLGVGWLPMNGRYEAVRALSFKRLAGHNITVFETRREAREALEQMRRSGYFFAHSRVARIAITLAEVIS